MTPVPRYEIFRKLPDKQFTWVESATSLDSAKDRLRHLAVILPGDYFILDAGNARIILPQDLASETPGLDTKIAFHTDSTNMRGDSTAGITAPENPSKKEPKDKSKRYDPPSVRRVRILR